MIRIDENTDCQIVDGRICDVSPFSPCLCLSVVKPFMNNSGTSSAVLVEGTETTAADDPTTQQPSTQSGQEEQVIESGDVCGE